MSATPQLSTAPPRPSSLQLLIYGRNCNPQNCCNRQHLANPERILTKAIGWTDFFFIKIELLRMWIDCGTQNLAKQRFLTVKSTHGNKTNAPQKAVTSAQRVPASAAAPASAPSGTATPAPAAAEPPAPALAGGGGGSFGAVRAAVPTPESGAPAASAAAR